MTTMLLVPADETQPVRAVEVEPGTAEPLQALVGGYLEGIGGPGWSAFINEDGKALGLAVNPRATTLWWTLLDAGGDVLVGDVVFCGPPDANGDETPAPDWLLGLVD